MKHVNIPVFVPHQGCPNDCVFCNQRTISGKSEFKIDSVRSEIEAVLSTVPPDAECEIAFFGGSFTGIERSLMISLLSIAGEYVRAGRAVGIRVSTRPDYINSEILEILKSYRVKTIELGIQSMDDRVLEMCRRGHTSRDSRAAMEAVKAAGFRLIAQMMTGLPGASAQSETDTARQICSLYPDGARIYPTVIFQDTRLAEMAADGEYIPLTLEESLSRSAEVYRVFLAAGVEVIRVGLCSSENLLDGTNIAAGEYHPAMGELIAGEVYRGIIEVLLSGRKNEKITLLCPCGQMSKVIGQKRKNTLYFKENYNIILTVRESCELRAFEIKEVKECI